MARGHSRGSCCSLFEASIWQTQDSIPRLCVIQPRRSRGTCLACRFNEGSCKNALDSVAKRWVASLLQDANDTSFAQSALVTESSLVNAINGGMDGTCGPLRSEVEFTVLANECRNGKYLTPERSCQDREACWPPYVNRRYPKVGSLNESRPDDGLIGGVCAECPDDCNQCELWDKCTECRHSTYLSPDDRCNDTCPETHYPHNPKENETDSSVGRICVACEGNCSHCITKTEPRQTKPGFN